MVNLSFMGYRLFRHISIAALVLSMSLVHAFAQSTAFKSEDDLKKQASKYFDDEEYGQAYPLYSQLLSNYPKDPVYNFRFGVCMLKASDDKEKPIPYLEYASKSPDADKEALFWLGKAYHLNYRFDDAIGAYTKFKAAASKSLQQKLQVDREIEACNNGKKLLRYITDITVLEKKDLVRADFFRSYDLAGIGGKFLVRPDDFTTSLDKKKKDQSVVFLSPNNDMVYFSSYGDKGETGKDIYMIRRLPNGGWGKPQPIPGPINTPYDEDFPYLHPNGKVLYFCSKGHNSMGGYDVFKSTLDENTNTWGKPVNLDFPINTPDDDILYVTDGDEQNAYFSSGRGSVDGRITVYKVKVERRPIDVAMLKGTVKPYRSDQRLDSRITVKDLADGETVGVFTANKEGSYFMDLPNGGKFLFTVETPGMKTQSEMVELPIQYELKMMRQIITYEEDKLVLKTFTEGAEDNSYMDALAVIKEKAKLEVNKDEPVPEINDNNPPDTTGKTNTPVANNNTKTNPSDLSNDQIVKIAYDDAKEASEDAKELKSEADMAFNIANGKNDLALSKAKEAEQILAGVNSITDPQQKQASLDKANNLNREADKLTKETVAAFNIAKKLDADAKAKQEEADLSTQYAKDLENAVKSNSKDALAKLEEQQKKIEEVSQKSNGSGEVYNSLKSEADNKQRELIKAREKSESLQEDIEGLAKESDNLRTEASNTKNQELKNSILAQAKDLDDEKVDKQKELDANNEKVTRLQDEAAQLKNDAEMVSSLMNQIKGNDNATDVTANNTTNNTTDNSTSNNTNNTASNNTSSNSTTSDNTSASNTTNNNTTANNTAGNNSSTSDNTASNNTTSDNTSGNNTTDNSTSSNTSNTGNASNNSVDYSTKYENQLADAGKIDNAYESETAKANLYKSWVDDLNKDLADNKQALKNAKTKEDKTLYKQKVADLEKQVKEKDKLSKDAFTKAEQAKKDQPLATNNTNNTTGNNTTDNTTANSNTNPDNTTASNSTTVPAAYNQQYSDKLKDLDQSAATDYEKEQKRSGMYTEWAKSIDKDIEQKKQEAASTTDPEMKALLDKKIQELEKLSKEKTTLASESSKKADQIKGQTSVAGTNTSNTNNTTANNTSDNSSNSNTAANNITASTVGDSTGTSVADETDYVTKHDKELENADKLSSSYQKELERSKVYDQWVKDINAEIAEQKTVLKDTKDKNQKKAINEKIKTLEADAKDKKQLADASAKNAEKLKGQDVLATNNTNTSGNDNASNNNNAGNTTTDNASNNVSNNTTNNNSTSTDNAAANNTANTSANNTTNDNTAAGNNNTNNNNTASNNTVADNTSNTANNTSAGNSTGNNTSNTTNNNTTVTDNTAGNNTSANNTAGNNNNTGNTPIEGSHYTMLTNAALEKKADQLTSESQSLMEQSEALRSDGSEEEANTKKKQAEDKKLEAASLLAEANRNEFNNNNNQLEELAKLSSKRTEADLSLAELLKDEAKTYFDKAQESRKVADSATDFYTKQSAMQKAYDNEMTALEKQKRSNDIYIKYNPGYASSNSVVASNTTTNPANNTANNTANNNTSGTNDTSASRLNSNSNNTTSDNTTANNTTASNNAANNTSSNNTGNTSSNTANNNTTAGNNSSNSNNTASNNTAADNTSNSTNNTTANTANNTANNNTAANNNAGNNTTTNNTSTNNTASNNTTSNPDTSSARIVPLSPEQVEVVKNSTEYRNYMTIKSESDQATKEALRERKVADEYKSEADRLQGLANQLKQDAGSITDPKQKQDAQKQVKDYETQASINRNRADSVTELANNSEAAANAKRTEADLFLNSLDQDLYENLSAVTGDKKSSAVAKTNNTTNNNTSNTAVNNTAGTNTNSANHNTNTTANNSGTNTNANTTANNTASSNNTPVITTLSANDVFVKTNGAAYSPSQPIPIDQKRPDGISFSVQIGAFKNPIPQDLFKGMKPIIGETTPQGVIRYTAGTFKAFNTANSVKDEIRALGYPDAFVVAFKDGKRISMSEALAAQQGSGVNNTGNDNAVVTNNNTASNTNNNPANNNPSNTNINTTNTNAAAANNNEAASEDLVTVKGLLYTVQVGVYARPVSSIQLFNITPLYSEKAPNGYIRYTSGIYNDINKAVQAKNIIVEIGVKDAFVTAYYNGKRISIAEAKQLEATNGASVFATAANINVMPSRGQGGAITQLNNNVQNTPVNTTNTPGNSTNTTNTPINNTPVNNPPANTTGTTIAQKVSASVEDAGVVYKVQIGAFKEEVPIDIANKFISIASGGIRNYKDENGLTIYTLGVYKSYDAANALKTDLVREGLTDAFVVAYSNGKKITIEEARNLLGQ